MHQISNHHCESCRVTHAMTHRTSRRWKIVLLALAVALACGRASDNGTVTSRPNASPETSQDGATVAAAGAASPAGVRSTSSAGDAAGPGGSGLPANHLGRIPILEYHVIGGTKNALYTRTPESLRRDLEDVYARGYRPITVSQMLDKDFRDVPAGMSPVIFVFDDA